MGILWSKDILQNSNVVKIDFQLSYLTLTQNTTFRFATSANFEKNSLLHVQTILYT